MMRIQWLPCGTRNYRTTRRQSSGTAAPQFTPRVRNLRREADRAPRFSRNDGSCQTVCDQVRLTVGPPRHVLSDAPRNISTTNVSSRKNHNDRFEEKTELIRSSVKISKSHDIQVYARLRVVEHTLGGYYHRKR